jgi:hypothetical protein
MHPPAWTASPRCHTLWLVYSTVVLVGMIDAAVSAAAVNAAAFSCCLLPMLFVTVAVVVATAAAIACSCLQCRWLYPPFPLGLLPLFSPCSCCNLALPLPLGGLNLNPKPQP